MNFSKKDRWKYLLILCAFLIAGESLWYTSVLVRKLEKQEKNNVQLWAEAIQKKARLVKYANELFNQIGSDEKEKVKLWAGATGLVVNENNTSSEDLNYLLDVIKNNTTVPVILTNDSNKIITYRNLDSLKQNDTAYVIREMKMMRDSNHYIEIEYAMGHKDYLYYSDSRLFTELKVVLNDLVESFMIDVETNSASVPVILTDSTQTKIMEYGNIEPAKLKGLAKRKELIASMGASNPPIMIELPDEGKQYIYYEESSLSKELRYFPYFELIIIGLFLLLAYYLFNSARKAEQERVWVGMAKETAHQLGTPLTSMIAWIEYLKTKNVEHTGEMEKDVKRLETITSRFSKIGAAPQLEPCDLLNELQQTIDYMKTRSSQKVKFIMDVKEGAEPIALLNPPLFSWVIENLVRNAIDAMMGAGSIIIHVSDADSHRHGFLCVDVTDSGKGIPQGKFKTVFEPGYTTKSRGWGLGLSLCKRIIEDYHGGKIFVKSSEINKGTTFRILLKKP